MRRHAIIVPFCALPRITVIATLLLLLAAAPLSAQTYYVFYRANSGYIYNNGSNGGVKDSFTKNCIWVANGNLTNDNNNLRNIYSYTANSSYMRGGNGSFTLGNSQSSWRIANNVLAYRSNNTYHVYLTNNGLSCARNQQNNGFTPTAITINNNEPAVNPTLGITSAGLVDGGIQLAPTFTGGYAVCKSATVNGVKYYWDDNTEASSTSRPPLNEDFSDATITWQLTSGNSFASLSNGGLLTFIGEPTADFTIRITANKGNYRMTNDVTLTVESVDALIENEGEIEITPSTATLDIGESMVFQASSKIELTTHNRPPYTEITIGDTKFYRVHGILFTEQPSITTDHYHDVPFYSFNWSVDNSNGWYIRIEEYYTEETNLITVYRTEQMTEIPTTSKLNVSGKYRTATFTAQAIINIPQTYVDIAGISCGGLSLSYGQSGKLTPHTWKEQTGAMYVDLRYSSSDENIATVSADGTVTATGVGQVEITIQSVRMDGTTDGAPSCVVSLWIQKGRLEAPTIDINSSGQVTITDNNAPSVGATIYYTTDGRGPAYSDTRREWDGNTFTVPNMATVMAIAIADDNYNNSAVSSKQYLTTGIDATARTLYFNDLEDHTWTYYSTKPDADYPDNLRSPDPRNVVITYNGGWVNGGTEVAVSATENVNKFVYYKTIEKKAWGQDEGRWLTGNYAYQVIPNPFSKRPAVYNGNNKTYYGFGGWKITSGGEYISGYDNNQVLPLDKIINFINLDNNYTPNCISAQITLEATWVAASVVTTNANITGNLTGMNGSTYETNFIVYTDGGTHTVSGLTTGATISNNYPDGTPAGSATISSFTTNTADAKLEYIKIGDGIEPVHPTAPNVASSTTIGSGTFTAQGGMLIVGRGCKGTVSTLTSGGGGGEYKYRIESGKYQLMYAMQSNASNHDNFGKIVLGCDYDRAADDGIEGNGTGDNTKLRIVNFGSLNGGGATGMNANSELQDITIKSGYYGFSANRSLWTGTRCADGYGLGIGGNPDGYSGAYNTLDYQNNPISYSDLGGGTANSPTWVRIMSFYVGPTHGAGKNGVNRLLIEGGEFGNINGGGNNPGSQNTIGFHFRMKGGWVKGAIYGTASISNSSGSRKLVFTGGEVNGWVAGGCNGTDFGNGQGYNEGTCYIYAGGRTEFCSHDRQGNYNNAYGLVGNVPGGQIFGAGRGLAPDNGHKNANQHYCGSTTTSYVTVADETYVEKSVYGGGYNGVAQNSHVYVTGGTVGQKVFGGTARAVSTDATWRCNNTYVRMYGGSVKEGVYGGHDETGVQFGNADVAIYGGTIGDESALINTSETAYVHGGGYGQLTVTQGDVNVTVGNSQTGPTIYGDVYGGSALGQVNATATFTITYTTTPLTVAVTNPNFNNGKKTDVTLNNGIIKGSLYGGALGDLATIGNGHSNVESNVYGPVAVTVNGGSVTGGVFGGNNINGMPKSTVAVTINGTDFEPAPGEYAVKAVYGGGNMAPYTGNPTVSIQGGIIENAYGGGLGTTAVITGNTGITMTGGKAGSLFGGGSQANVTGSVTINMQGGLVVNDIYGGGALANTNTTSGTTTVNLTGGEVYNVFGGGLGDEDHYAQVRGNVQVLLNQGVADNAKGCVVDNAIFGCNNVNGTPLGTVTVHVFATQNKGFSSILVKPAKNADKTLHEGNHDIKAVYGGGNMAAYRPTAGNTPTHVIIDGCGKSSIEYVYGGGNAAPVPATQVDINGSYQIANVFGGGNGKDALPNGDPNPGADVGIYEVDQNTFNSTTARLRYDDPGNEKDDDQYYILYGDTANASAIGTTQVYILGGVVSQVFGGSNTKGDIVKEAKVILGDENLTYCEFSIGGVYGGSNEAYLSGNAAIDMHCIGGMDEIYGGSKRADISKDVVLTINGGRYGKVFGGNNISGRINGSITVNIEQTGCLPIEIGELYGGGNQAPYSIYGYDGTEIGEDGIERPRPIQTPQQGVIPHHDPVINIVSCESIGTVYGGGFKALMVGSPEININMVRGWVNGRYQSVNNQDPDKKYENAQNMDHMGTIGTVYGGGNQAEVVGSTRVNVGTQGNVSVHDVTKAVYDVIKIGRTDITNPNYNGGADQTKDLTITVEGANITNNIYGGGNNAAVTGQTNITIGPAQ